MMVRADHDYGSAMTDTELRDQLMTLLVAGHDTTATGLAWALERLTRHPAILDKAVRAAEAAAAGDPDGDEYLEAVARETLRIRPVVFEVGRVLKEPVELAGYRLPAGVMVAPGIGLVHSSSTHYPEPDRFDPDRMVGVTPGPTVFLPFGGGIRRCLGAAFAAVEMRIVLREVLRRVDLCTTTAAGERPKVDYNKEFSTTYDVTKLASKPEPGKAAIEAFFTSKGSDVYAILPRWPGGVFQIKDVPGVKSVSLLGSTQTVKFTGSNGGVSVNLPELPEDLRAQLFASQLSQKLHSFIACRAVGQPLQTILVVFADLIGGELSDFGRRGRLGRRRGLARSFGVQRPNI